MKVIKREGKAYYIIIAYKSSSQAVSLLTYSETIWHDKKVQYTDRSGQRRALCRLYMPRLE